MMKGVSGNLPISQLGQQIINGKKKKRVSYHAFHITGSGWVQKLGMPANCPPIPPANNPFFHSTFFVHIRNVRHHHDKNAFATKLNGTHTKPTPHRNAPIKSNGSPSLTHKYSLLSVPSESSSI